MSACDSIPGGASGKRTDSTRYAPLLRNISSGASIARVMVSELFGLMTSMRGGVYEAGAAEGAMTLTEALEEAAESKAKCSRTGQ
ncbi:hypothetical protein [Robbsia andropogonis]|uniref:hypothetical protein n=1 Tax=Robbsia andropogonis TaxID=28092 RepID=UPI001642ABB4|nr:hypothetical protein [Robbsia andropogonis]